MYINWYKIIVLQYGYLNPKKFTDQMVFYYEGKGWPPNGNPQGLMRYWMEGYIHRQEARTPDLNEIERLVMRAFLDIVDERLIVRLFNVLQSFKVTDKLIIFYVPQDNAQDFAKWLETLPVGKIIQAYNREIKVRFTSVPSDAALLC